jgi:hypothetical protein
MSNTNKSLILNDGDFKGTTFPEPTHAATFKCRCAPPMFRSIAPIERCGATDCYASRTKWWTVTEGNPTTYKQYTTHGT